MKSYRNFFFYVTCLLLILFGSSKAQEGDQALITDALLGHTPPKNQGRTGTCWSFATTSFMESELMRMGKGEFNLSEMFFVRNTYQNKITEYLLYQGNNNFGEGGQAHDVLRVVQEKGIVPDTVFPGVKTEGRFDHRILLKELAELAKKENGNSKNFNASFTGFADPLLDRELGRDIKEFSVDNRSFTPAGYRDFLGIHPEDYIELSSFSHHPFFEPFVLEVPDNWAHRLYWNLPVDDLVKVMIQSLKNGYTVCWDGDDTEQSFSHRKGMADVPEEIAGKISQELRQQTFYNRETTDDHLMHIVGLSHDKNGKYFFYTKNSWGSSGKLNGFLYLSEDYVRLKTIAILVHRNAIPQAITERLRLK